MSGRVLKKVTKVVLACALLLAILVGPFVTFYLMWMLPTSTLEPIGSDVGVSWVIESLPDEFSVAGSEILFRERDLLGLPSVSAAIAFDGELQWAGAVGYSDLSAQIQVTLDSRYRIGSTSKALTASLLARLLDKEMIDLDLPATEYFPNVPDHLKQITPRMLASHTAGVRHYSNSPFLIYWPARHPSFSNTAYETIEDGLEIFINDELLFIPGTGFNYSTYGFSLLSRLMEGATETEFSTLLASELFEPANMKNTAVDKRGEMVGRVSFYTSSTGKYSEAYVTDSSYKIAGGGIVSTPTDLVNLGQLLFGNGFVSEQSKQIMWSPVILADGSDNSESYGLGWRINTTVSLLGEDMPIEIIHHGGSQVGGVTFFMLVPDYGISVAAMANTDAGRQSVEDITYELVRLAVTEITKRR